MTDQELEQQLRSWYRAEVGDAPTVPVDLRDDVTSIPRTMPAPTRRSGSRRRTITLLAAAAILIGGGALAAGSGFLRLFTVETPPPTPQPSQAFDASPSPTTPPSSPLPEASPMPGPAAAASQDMVDAMDGFLLATDDVGWITTTSGFYRTRDMGATWTQVRPPGWTFTSATRLVDAETMIAASDSQPMVIAATHDGGVSWVESKIDDPAINGGPTFSFQTASKGFATFGDKAGEDNLRVYATTDGGVTWTGPRLGTVPAIEYSMGNKIQGPSGGILYLYSGKADNEPFDNHIVLSLDGGATWKTRSFPIGDVSRKDDQKQIAHIWLEDGGRIRMAITAGGNRGSIWVSDDDARSWHLVTAIPAGIQPLDSDFVSPTTWVFFDQGSGVESTADGGVHWRTLASGGPRLYDIGDKTFVSQDRGWVSERCRSSSHDAYCDGTTAQVVFLATTDGGRTWTRIGAPTVTRVATPGPSVAPDSAAWASAGTMIGGKFGGRGPGLSATLSHDGRVLIVGGARAEAAAELYDPAKGTWTATGSLAHERTGQTVTPLPDGRVLVAGGSYDGHDRTTTELYDPDTGRWSAGPSMKRPRSGHTAVALRDGRVLVVGGVEGETATAEIYDPVSGAWTTTGSPVATRFGSNDLTVLEDGRVLAAGGVDGNDHDLASAELFDPSTGRWTATGSMTSARSGLTATLLLDSRVLVVGGARSFSGRELPSAELYDPATGRWSATGDMTTPRSAPTLTVLEDGSVLAAGGSVQLPGVAKALDSAERYDPASGTWTTTASMSVARYGQVATLLADGTVLVAGGHATGAFEYVLSAERYRPGGAR